uniref:Synaptonemal complex protein 2 n=1 Tax=Pogona vitticeps TaxID=103695 RepID=A0ABM5G5G6_9SAUR
MVTWFEKAKGFLENNTNEKNNKLTVLFEDFFDILMVVHDTSSKGKIQILENFILRTCALATDKNINIYIQQEAVRKLNTMLNAMPRDIRKKIISTKEMLHVMNDMGKRILEAGDYDLQVAITEALCRMTSEKQRGELASQWFSMEFISNAFKGIKDSEFETDCRKFLNQVNGMLGDKRRVFTYPCLSAILDNYELQIPADDNLEEFWIDFNTGSRSVSFYVAADDEGNQWETICIPEEEVDTYIIEEKDQKKVLIIHVNNPISVDTKEGDKITLHFDSALEIADAVSKVYGATKCKGFTRKNAMSIAKTTVHVIFDESGSQVLVPESQMSPLNEGSKLDEKGYALHRHSKTQMALNQKADKVDFQTVQSIITPGKRKMSEASMIVPSSASLSMQSTLPLANTSTPRKSRVKMPLQIMSSVEKNSTFSIRDKRTMEFSFESACSATRPLGKNKSVEQKTEGVINIVHNEEDVDTGEKEKLNEVIDIIFDSRQEGRSDKQLMPDSGVTGIKIQKRQMCSVPEKIISNCSKQTGSASRSAFYQGSSLSDRAAKQRAFSSIFEMTSELRNKQQCSGKNMKEQQNETNKIPTKNVTRNSAESQNRFKDVDEKTSRSSKIVSTKPEMPLNATSMNSLVNLKHSELVIEKNDYDDGFEGTVTSCDLSSGKKTTKKTDRGKSEKEAESKEIVEAAEMLINNISGRYKQNSGVKNTRKMSQTFSEKSTSFKKSGFSVSKKKSLNRSYGNLETTTLLNVTAKHLTNDVYNFNLSGFDEPTIKLGVQEFHLTKLEAAADFSMKMNHGTEGKSINQKKQNNKNGRNKSKKHLFSDTDTECRGDDTKTDISWLRESNRKPKPQLVDYSRIRKQKKSETLEANKISMSPPMKERFKKMESITNKTHVSKKRSDNDIEKIIQPTRSKRPRRAAQSKKCYKELSNSETESEKEEPLEDFIKKNMTEHKPVKHNAVKQPKIQQHMSLTETKKEKMVKQPKRVVKSRGCEPQTQTELSPPSSFESPVYLEKMRCCEKYAEEESMEEHTSLRVSSSSPCLQELTPEIVESSGNKTFSGLGKINGESIQLKQLPEKGRKLVFETEELPPVLSPVSLTNLSPFTMRKKVPSVQNEEVSKLQEKIYYPSEAGSIKICSLSRSSDIEQKDFSEGLVKKAREESISPSQLSTPNRNREELCHKESLAYIHESGPTIHTDFKRLYRADMESDSDEEEIRREETKTKLLPRKLFKTDDNTSKVSENLSSLSLNDTSVFDGEGWDADTSSVGVICQKLHKETARKIQNRSKRIENFTKQSLKMTHEHMNIIGSELHKHRAKQLENLHSCLIKELESFEKDSQALRNVEKDFANFSKKQCEMFSTYNKNEQRRLQNIKTSFEKNIYHNADSEQDIFISQMHRIKEDMKGIQERLLKEMHEEELLNVRKGLQSLFMAENMKF